MRAADVNGCGSVLFASTMCVTSVPRTLQRIGNQGAMATPPDCFRAHDHGGPGFTSESEKTLDTFLKLLCLHVIGVTAK